MGVLKYLIILFLLFSTALKSDIYASQVSKPFIQIGFDKFNDLRLISKENNRIVSINNYKNLQFWDLKYLKLLKTIKTNSTINAIVKVSKNQFAIIDFDKKLKFYDINTGRFIKEKILKHTLKQVGRSKISNNFYGINYGYPLKIVKLDADYNIVKLNIPDGGMSAAFDITYNYLIKAYNNGYALFETNTEKEIDGFLDNLNYKNIKDTLYKYFFLKKKENSTYNFQLVHRLTNKVYGTYHLKPLLKKIYMNSDLISMNYKKTKIVIADNYEKKLQIVDIKTGKLLSEVKNLNYKIKKVLYDPFERYIAIIDKNNTLYFLDIKSLKTLYNIESFKGIVSSLRFSKTGDTFFSKYKINDSLIIKKVTNIKQNIELTFYANIKSDMEVDPNLFSFTSIAANTSKFLKDKSQFITTYDNKNIAIWDYENIKLLGINKSDNLVIKLFYDDITHQLIAAEDTERIVFYDINNLNKNREIKDNKAYIIENKSGNTIIKAPDKNFKEKINDLIISYNGDLSRSIITAGNNGALKKWFLSNGEFIHINNAHKRDIRIIDTDKTKNILVTADDTGIINVINLKTFEMFKLKREIDFASILNLYFDKNNNLVVLIFKDKKLILESWDITANLILKRVVIDKQLNYNKRSASLDHTDSVLAIASGNIIIIYNLKNKRIKKIQTRGAFINSIDINTKDNKLVTAHDNGKIKIWDLNNLIELATFISFSKNEWIIMTPEGYFNSSRNGIKYINITKSTKENLEPFDISQLYDHFFRPDLVKLKLAGEDISKYINSLTYQDALSNPPPKLAFKAIDDKEVKTSGFSYDDVKTKKEKVKLSFNIKEHDNGGIGLIRIYQEGKLIQTIGKGKINKQSANVYTILEQEKQDKKLKVNQDNYLAMANKQLKKSLTTDFQMSVEDTIAKVKQSTTTNKSGTYNLEIELKSGKNEISIEAFNKTNTVTSYRENITIDAKIPKQKPNLYVISAGVNEFEAPYVNNLKYSQNDAKAIKEAAEKKMGTVFDKVEVKYLLGKDVTKANILKAAQEISKKAKLTDTVLFYISTHGRAYQGKLYLVPYNNKSVTNWIDFEQTFKAVQSIKALNQIFIIDACESGKANDIVSSVYDSRASVLAKSSGVHMLLATTKGTFAFEHPDKNIENGVFTHRILEAMKDKTTDKDNDSFISILELSKKLKEPANNTDYQHPVIRNVGSDVVLEKVE